MVEGTVSSVDATVREIRRRTRKKYSAEEKVRIVLEGLRGEEKIAELCRREGIHQNMYYKWSKEFLEAASSDWWEIQNAKQTVTKQRRCTARTSSSSR